MRQENELGEQERLARDRQFWRMRDHRLARRYLEGGTKAGELLFTAAYTALRYYCFSRAVPGRLNAQDREDLLQRTMAKGVALLDRYHGRCRFTTWLVVIARNETMNLLAKRARRRTHASGSLHQVAVRPLWAQSLTDLQLWESWQRCEELLSVLDAPDRELVSRKVFGGVSIREMARQQGVGEHILYYRYALAMRQLRIEVAMRQLEERYEWLPPREEEPPPLLAGAAGSKGGGLDG